MRPLPLALAVAVLLSACQPNSPHTPGATAPTSPNAPPAFAFTEATVLDLQRKMTSGSLSSHAVVQAYLDRIAQNAAAYDALNKIRLIITVPPFGQKFNYKRIPELNGLMQTVRTAHDQMLDDKRSEILETVRQCMEATHTAANGDPKALDIVRKSDAFFDGYKAKIANCKSLALLDGMIIPLSQYKDETVSSIEIALAPPTPKPVVTKKDVNIPAVKPKKVKSYSRQILFPAKTLRDDADIDAYVEKIREQLRNLLDGCDEIKLN